LKEIDPPTTRFALIFLLLALPVIGAAQSVKQPNGTIAVDDSAAQDAAIAVRIRGIFGDLDGF
jgi:small conductance mechanosensitive channel